MKDIANLWALVTGASSGIGREIARELANRGCNLVLAARSEKALKSLAAELEKTSGVKCVVMACDLSVKGAAEILYRRTLDLGLVVDILVNNAGVGLPTAAEFSDPARLESMIRLNMTALTTLSAAFGADMRSRRKGFILNVASVVANFSIPQELTYCATKTFVAEYTRTLRYELHRFGVGVTTLYPGTTRTNFFDAAGVKVLGTQADSMADPADVARKAVAAMLKRRKTITPGAVPKLTRLAGKLLPRGMVYTFLRNWRAKREARYD